MSCKYIPHFILLIFFILTCTGCTNDDFYKKYKNEEIEKFNVTLTTLSSEIIQDKSCCNGSPLYQDTLRILAIGNSFTQNAVETYVKPLLEYQAVPYSIGSLIYSGCSLEQLLDDIKNNTHLYTYTKIKSREDITSRTSTVAEIIDLEDWDIITLQQVSYLSGIFNTYYPYLDEIIDWVSERTNAKIFFHQTWAYQNNSKYGPFSLYDNDQSKMYGAILGANKKLIDRYPQIYDIIPAGTAIQNGRTSYLGDAFTQDGYHLESSYGKFTAACVWVEKLTGKCILENKFRPIHMDEKMVEMAHVAAHCSVLNPFSVTDLSSL